MSFQYACRFFAGDTIIYNCSQFLVFLFLILNKLSNESRSIRIMKTAKLKIVKRNETIYWSKSYLKELGITKVEFSYMFDENQVTNLCELKPSYDLRYINFHVDSDLTDDQWENFHNECNKDNQDIYVHCDRIVDFIGFMEFEYEDQDEYEYEFELFMDMAKGNGY